jgi:branched-chain amino acid aminotransferase
VSDVRYHVDGRLVPASEAAVDVRDRGFVYGDGAVERLRVYGGDPFEWAAHANRLSRTCETLGFERAIPPTDDLRERVAETLDANGLTDARVRVSITRGIQDRGPTPDPRVDPTVVVTASELPRGGTPGEVLWDEPATLRTVERRRAPEAVLPAAGTQADLCSVLARQEADGDEALLRDLQGTVCGGASSDVFFVRDGTLHTPTADLPIPAGITRAVVLDIADGESFPVEAGRYAVGDLRGADEVFLTDPTWEIRPVGRVDGTEKPVGPITRLCARLFDERVERVHYDRSD